VAAFFSYEVKAYTDKSAKRWGHQWLTYFEQAN
jgi:hypothetical protein